MVGVLASGLALASSTLPTRAQTKPQVVATFSILADLTRNVSGDLVEIRTLVPADADVHTFEPSPADSATLAEADVILQIGLEFETWLEPLIDAAGTKGTLVTTTDGVNTIEFSGEHDDHGEGEKSEATAESTPEGTAEAEHDDHSEQDPHVWHDVKNVVIIVGNIRDALVAADPANTATYKANADKYIAELEALDKFVVDEVAKLPEARRVLFTTHEALGYFGARYGFRVDTALGATTEAGDPAAGEVATLIEEVKAAGVPVIFAENVTNPAILEQIARDAGVKVGPTLYTDALGAPGSEGDTYLKLIRYNVNAIVSALGQ
jgi:ABC-type Zn uptake system ZnuABC Zn-binding protein ZnuA